MEASALLAKGRTLPAVELDLGNENIQRYRAATGDAITPAHLVPPAAIVAWSLRPLLGDLRVLGGAVHTGQEMEMARVVVIGERLNATLTVINSSQRGGAFFAVVEQVVTDQSGHTVLRGRSNVVFSEVGE